MVINMRFSEFITAVFESVLMLNSINIHYVITINKSITQKLIYKFAISIFYAKLYEFLTVDVGLDVN